MTAPWAGYWQQEARVLVALDAQLLLAVTRTGWSGALQSGLVWTGIKPISRGSLKPNVQSTGLLLPNSRPDCRCRPLFLKCCGANQTEAIPICLTEPV